MKQKTKDKINKFIYGGKDESHIAVVIIFSIITSLITNLVIIYFSVFE